MSPLKRVAVHLLAEDNKRLRAMLAAAEAEIERLEKLLIRRRPAAKPLVERWKDNLLKLNPPDTKSEENQKLLERIRARRKEQST